MNNPNKYRIQIIYSRPTPNGFLDYSYRVNDQEYFYPASLAKLPLCILAYDKINNLKKAGVTIENQLITSGPYAPPAKFLYIDSLKHLSLKDHIIRCFVVSDNSSPNYLYEFLGHEYINKTLHDLDFNKIKINQRFSHSDTLQNRITFPVKLVGPKGDTTFSQNGDTSSIKTNPQNEILLGKRYIDAKGKMIRKPMNFGLDNNISLEQLHQLWKEVCYPNIRTKLNLSLENKKEIKAIASLLPNQSAYPNYYHFADNYRKFLFYGDSSRKIPSNIQIANKVGLAYGFISDIAYFKDQISGIEFSLSTVMFVNDNETFNDGIYQYESIGLPFLGNLGRILLDYESYLRNIQNKSLVNISSKLKYSYSLKKK